LFALTGEHRTTIARGRPCMILHDIARIIMFRL
jgi:hypothetical protein